MPKRVRLSEFVANRGGRILGSTMSYKAGGSIARLRPRLLILLASAPARGLPSSNSARGI